MNLKRPLFILFIIPLIFANYPLLSPLEREAVPINESLRSVEGVYSVFPFTDCSLIPRAYGGYGYCNEFISDFCIGQMLSIKRSILPLTSEEENELNSVLSKIERGDSAVTSMKKKLSNLLLSKNCTTMNYIIYSKFINDPNLVNTLMFYDSILSIIFPPHFVFYNLKEIYGLNVGCRNMSVFKDLNSLILDFLLSFEGYLELQTTAYENYAEALNNMLSIVTEQADSLYYEGGGYSNYSTSAYVFYNEKIKSFIYKSRQNFTERRLSDFNAQDFSASFIYVRETSKKVSSERVKRLENCELAIMASPDYAISINYLITLYREIKEQRANLRSEYIAARSEALYKFNDAENRYKTLMNEKYWLINQPIVLYSLNKTQETTLEEPLTIPSNTLAEMKETLYGSGSSVSIKGLIESAEKDTQNRVKFFYAKGIERFMISVELSKDVINKSYKVEEISDEVLSSLDSKVRTKLNIAYGNLSKYPVYDISTASAYDLLSRKYSLASEIYNNYNPSNTTKGERIVDLYNAALMLDDVISISSKKVSDVFEMKKKSLKETLDDLNTTIQKAEKDGIDVTAELQLLNSKAILLNMNINNISYLDDSIFTLKKAKENIYSRAAIIFSDIPSIREKTYSILNSLAPYYDVYKYKVRLDSFEKSYFVDGFSIDKCLGNCRSLRSNYLSVLDELNKNSASLLSVYLSNRYSSKTTFDSIPKVDSYVNITTYLEINNDLSLGSDSQVNIKIKGIPFEANSIIESDYGVYGIKEGDYALIFFQNIKPNTKYFLKIKSYVRPATLISREIERVSLSNEKLVERISYTIDSIYNFDTLVLSDIYSADTCSVFMNNRMQRVTSYSNLSISLLDVKSGRQKIVATCTRNNPISFTTSDFRNVDNQVMYTLQLKSNYEDLNNVEYVFEILGSADEIQSDSIRVYDSKGRVPERFEFYRSNNKYYAKWLIPILSSEYLNYTISYSTTDIVAYYSKLKGEIENLSKQESVDVSNYIRDAAYRASRGKYDEAINSLEAARKEIAKVQSDRLENASITERLNKLTEHISQIKNKSNEIYNIATNLSISEINVEVAKQIAEFESNVNLIRSYLAKGDIKSAKSTLEKLEKTVFSTKIENTIYSREKKLYESLSQTERKILSLGKYVNISSALEKLNEIKSHLSLIGPSTANQDYYSALVNLNSAHTSLNELISYIDNNSESINLKLESKLKFSKSVLDNWKKKKGQIFAAFSLDKNEKIGSLPESIIEVLNRINMTDQSYNELELLYSKLKGYKQEERIFKIEEFEELELKSQKINEDLESYSKLIDQYKYASNELIKDTAFILEEKVNKGSESEKKRALELRADLSYAKDLYNTGKYLNSVLVSKYIKDQLTSIQPQKETLDLILVVYIALMLAIAILAFRILSKKEPPKIERKIEKFKLD